MLTAEVYIMPKASVSDPQGLAIKHALESLGYKNLNQVRIGKLIIIKLDSQDKKTAGQQVENICRQLLANTIIEDYSFKIKED
ncbi:MAG: phosphoribosylformylglycinamidine synthase subunit PurS [Candidatus Omnitrophica bacterium]|nr:phosphoribosylformylglycinamidine synthase subunit PurS [Candidatus Omnitrophota bacterium]